MNTFELKFDDKNLTVTLVVPAGASVLRHQVDDALREGGWDKFFLHDANLKSVIEVIKDKPISIVVAERRDAEFEVVVSKDNMSAALTVIAPFGGLYGTASNALLALNTKNVKFGVNREALAALLASAELDVKGALRQADVAFGIAPVNGVDTTFETLVTPFNRRLIKPRVKDDGSVDYHDLGDVPTVSPGDPVMRRQPPTAGEIGHNVLAQVLMPVAGKNLAFESHSGTQISINDENLLVATTQGVVIEHPRGVSIENIYRCEQVDLTTGNIKFDGNVIISGDVVRNMEIDCTGYVAIAGFVDCGIIHAGHDLQIAKGLSGGSAMQAGEARARAKSEKSITASFAQCATLDAGDGIIIDKLLMHCKTLSQTFVRVGGENGGNSNCIGGRVEAYDYIKFDNLGSDNGTQTSVILHGRFHELRQSLKQCSQEIQVKASVMQDLETVREKQKLKNPKADDELSQRIGSTLEVAKNEMASLIRLQKQLEVQLEAQFDLARIIIAHQVYPGIEITIADKTVKLNTSHKAGCFVYTLNGIVFKPGETKTPKAAKTTS